MRSLLSGDRAEDERRVQHLLRTIAEVNGTRGLDEVLVSVVDRCLELTRAERAILFLLEGDRLHWRVGRNHRLEFLPEDVVISQGTLRDARRGRPRIISNTAEVRPEDLGTSIISQRLLSVMSVPLRHRDRVIGVLYVDSHSPTRGFTDADFVLFQSIADQAAVAIVNAQLLETALEKQRQDRDLEIARHIQARFLPAGPLDLRGFDIFGCSHPYERTGGDCFDYVRAPDGAMRIVVGDVVGHGIPATLFMATARALLRGISASEPSLTGCAAKLNRQLKRDMEPGEYMTMLLLELDPVARTFSYVGAGHDAAFLVRADGHVEEMETTGAALGILDDASYRLAGPIALGPADVLLVCTDGITEAGQVRSSVGGEVEYLERFGKDHLKALLLEVRERGAEEIADAVREAVATWRGATPQEDDETLVVIKALDA